MASSHEAVGIAGTPREGRATSHQSAQVSYRPSADGGPQRVVRARRTASVPPRRSDERDAPAQVESRSVVSIRSSAKNHDARRTDRPRAYASPVPTSRSRGGGVLAASSRDGALRNRPMARDD